MPISSIVVKTDTSATKITDIKDEKDNKTATQNEVKHECVFVKVGNKAKIRIIKTGIQDNTNIEVLEGLKPGEIVITGPYTTVTKELNSGDKVSSKAATEPNKTK